MSDLERVLGEAEQARQEAEAAARRADELAAQAEAARARAEQEREGRRLAWAQQVVDAYDADLVTVEGRIQAARDRFAAAAVDAPETAVKTYLEWAEAAIGHYTLQIRIGTVAPMLGMEATPPEHAAPPPYSQALDWAIGERVAAMSEKARDAAADEIARHIDEGAPEA